MSDAAAPAGNNGDPALNGKFNSIFCFIEVVIGAMWLVTDLVTCLDAFKYFNACIYDSNSESIQLDGLNFLRLDMEKPQGWA